MTTLAETTDKLASARKNAKAWLAEIEDKLTDLDTAETGDDDTARDAAMQAIHESALSVMVRDGWREPYKSADDGAEEYEILLTWGGPGLRLWGTIGRHSEPETAELQIEDWGQNWTRYPAPEETLLRFASFFDFG